MKCTIDFSFLEFQEFVNSIDIKIYFIRIVLFIFQINFAVYFVNKKAIK